MRLLLLVQQKMARDQTIRIYQVQAFQITAYLSESIQVIEYRCPE